jgi:hypothetical protein
MIYGVGNKKLGETNLSNQECPNCNETNTVFIHGIVRYFQKEIDSLNLLGEIDIFKID